MLREIKVLDSTMSKMLTIQGRNKPEGSKFDEKFGRYPSHTLPTVLVYLPSYYGYLIIFGIAVVTPPSYTPKM